ncbi:conserved hypothetical protein [Rippkaea orientalis PCC 8801]|uniref:Uncharacterized protein n=1 Tax=Rippkaea orientalis (strain PCC 8801 / RF-1) TaxID=41431 RepID=B7JUW0_RIPO1|nr:hypothetical protein [Rippkaea orientalis]ACK66812.1 conserved hypothetical protein [Rippkaea orientalis PCC 8801]
MALFGLFGGKAQYVDEIDPNAPQQPEKKEAFFLEADDAKSLGNAEFMRKSYKIRRTFPKRPGGKGGEIVEEISSLKKSVASSVGSTESVVSNPQSSPETVVKAERRASDNSMDMFRQMAKDIKK